MLGPHVDIPRKLATQVFYFNPGWDPARGGCLRILADGEAVAELAPELGSASLIVRSEVSWHEVTPVAQRVDERLSVTATFQHPGTESPLWSRGADGAVRCHAAGSRLMGDSRP